MDTKKINYWEALMNFIKNMVGAGVFSIGVGFKYSGLLAAIVIMTIEALMIAHCVHLLAEALEFASEINDRQAAELEAQARQLTAVKEGAEEVPFEKEPVSFAKMAKLTIQTGKCSYAAKFANVVSGTMQVLISIQYTGSSALYLVFAAKTQQSLFRSFDVDLNVRYWILILWIPMGLLSFIPDLKGLAKASFLGNVMVIATYVITNYYIFRELAESNYKTDVKYIGSITELPIFFGILLFSFETVAVMFPLRAAMKDPKQLKTKLGIINVGFLISFILNMLMGINSYLAYGESLSDTILVDLPPKEVAARIAFIAVSLQIITTYPLNIYIAYKIVFAFAERVHGRFKRHYLWDTLIRLCLVLFTQIAAQAIPYVDLLLSLLGIVCATWLTLILGPMLSLIINTAKYSKVKKKLFFAKNIVIMMFATIFFISGFTFVIISLLKEIRKDYGLLENN